MKLWTKIKEFFGFFDANGDGQVDMKDVKQALDTVEKKIDDAVDETKRRARRVKEELSDVADAAKDVAAQAGDVVDAAKGKPRRGRPRKSTAAKKKAPAKKTTKS